MGGPGGVPGRHSMTWCGSPYSTRLRLVRSHSGPRGCDRSVSLSLEVPGDSSERARRELVTPGAARGAAGTGAGCPPPAVGGRTPLLVLHGRGHQGRRVTARDRACLAPRPALPATRPSPECGANPEASTSSGPFLPPAGCHRRLQGGPAAHAALSPPLRWVSVPHGSTGGPRSRGSNLPALRSSKATASAPVTCFL